MVELRLPGASIAGNEPTVTVVPRFGDPTMGYDVVITIFWEPPGATAAAPTGTGTRPPPPSSSTKMTSRSKLLQRRRQHGVGIVETMVGILIGMIVVLVVYNTLILAEEHKRANIGVADAQITGQLTQFILGREVANGGAALMMSTDELASCSDWRLKPMPVAIRAGATVNDRTSSRSSTARRRVPCIRCGSPPT